MKEAVFHYWCDNRAAKHPPRTIEGDTLLVYSPSKEKVVEVDVCETCQQKLTFAVAQELADTYGRDQTPNGIDPALCCPLPDCKRSNQPFKDKAGRARHLTRAHPEYEVA